MGRLALIGCRGFAYLILASIIRLAYQKVEELAEFVFC